MSSEVELSSNSVAAYTEGNKIVIPGYHPPVQFATHLAHELGHVLKNGRRFRRHKILTPLEIFETTLDISTPLKRWLSELFSTNELGTGNWRPDVINLIYETIYAIAKEGFNPFDPKAVDLQVVTDHAQFVEKATNTNFAASGITTKGSRRIALPTPLGHATEVPAYYTQFGVGIILERTLTDDPLEPIAVCLGEPTLPSHRAAYKTVETLIEESTFPTAKVIHRAWQNRLKSA